MQSKDGHVLRRFVPRVLALMADPKTDSMKKSVERAFENYAADPDASEKASQVDKIIDDILNGEQCSANQNASRLKT